MSKDLKYKVKIDGDLSFLDRAKRSVSDFVQAIRLGMSIDIGRRLIDGVMRIKDAFVRAVKDGIAFNSTIEDLRVSFTTLLGGVSAADKRIRDLVRFAATTPFEMTEVANASRVLEVMTRGALAGGKGLRLVGDIASSVQRPFQEVAMWVGRLYDGIMSGAKIGEPLQRLQEMGAVSGDLRKKLESLNEVAGGGAATWAAAEEGFARFAGQMEARSQTMSGRMSTLRDNMRMAFGSATASLFTSLKGTIDKLAKQFESPGMVMGLRQIVGAMGALAEGALRMVGALASAGPVFSILATGAIALGTILLGFKFAELTVGVARWTGAKLASVLAIKRVTAATAEETAALAANTAVRAANARMTYLKSGRTMVPDAGIANAMPSAAARFGASLMKIAAWAYVGLVVGKAIAGYIDRWSSGRAGDVQGGANSATDQQNEFRKRMVGISSEEDKGALLAEIKAAQDAANEKLKAKQGEWVKSSFDKAEIKNLQGDVEAYGRMLSALRNLSPQQMAQYMKTRDSAATKKEEEDRSSVAASIAKGSGDGAQARNKSVMSLYDQARYQQTMSGDNDQAKLNAIDTAMTKLTAEAGALGKPLDRDQTWMAEQLKAGKTREEIEKLIEAADERRVAIAEEMLRLDDDRRGVLEAAAKAQKDAALELGKTVKDNNERAADIRFGRLSDEQKLASVEQQIASAIAKFTREKDPEKKEALRGLIIEKAGQRFDLKDSLEEEQTRRAKDAMKAQVRTDELLAFRNTRQTDISALFDRMYAGGTAAYSAQDEEMLRYQKEMVNVLKEVRDNTKGVR